MTLIKIARPKIEHTEQKRNDPMRTPFVEGILGDDPERDIHTEDIPRRNEQRGGGFGVEDPRILRSRRRMPMHLAYRDA